MRNRDEKGKLKEKEVESEAILIASSPEQEIYVSKQQKKESLSSENKDQFSLSYYRKSYLRFKKEN